MEMNCYIFRIDTVFLTLGLVYMWPTASVPSGQKLRRCQRVWVFIDRMPIHSATVPTVIYLSTPKNLDCRK